VKFNHPEKTTHPCQFPVELIERFVLSMTNIEGKVLDPYMGSGSALVAASKHGRLAYGCDISKEYYDITINRMKALDSGTLRMREMNTPIYQPIAK